MQLDLTRQALADPASRGGVLTLTERRLAPAPDVRMLAPSTASAIKQTRVPADFRVLEELPEPVRQLQRSRV